MKSKVFNYPLGMGVGAGTECSHLGVLIESGLSHAPKLWLLSAISAGVGLASSLIGGAQASKASREARRRQRQEEAEEQAWYNRRYNENYIDTAAGQNLVRRATEIAKENWRREAGAQAVAGGTDAATQMAKEAGNRMVGETIADIAATDQAQKANVDAQHRQAKAQYAQMDMNREMQRAQNVTDAAQNASNAIMSMAGALEQGGAGKSLIGNSNNSKVIVDPSVHEKNLSTPPQRPLSHADNDLLARMANGVRGKIGV